VDVAVLAVVPVQRHHLRHLRHVGQALDAHLGLKSRCNRSFRSCSTTETGCRSYKTISPVICAQNLITYLPRV
jgi:hypothetical protein